MILIYSPSHNQQQIDNSIKLLKDRFSLFFIEDKHFIYSSETNQKLLRDTILKYSVFLFHCNSIKDIPMSPTEISELIIFLLKNGNDGRGSDVQFELEKLYFTTKDIDTVYPQIFEVFRDKSK